LWGQKANPKKKDLFQVGTIASILQLLKLPDGTVKVLVEGESRVSVQSLNFENEYIVADVSLLDETEELSGESGDSLLSLFESFVNQSKKIPQEVLSSLSSMESLSRLIDSIAAQNAFGRCR
jgi:ATP-dependent Lon protease